MGSVFFYTPCRWVLSGGAPMEKFSSMVTKQPLVGRAPFKSTEEATYERSRAPFKILQVHRQSTEKRICSYGARERY